MGYLNNEKDTQSTFDAEGFLHTGDLGSIDRDGLVTIHDRIKELIKARTGSKFVGAKMNFSNNPSFRFEEQEWHLPSSKTSSSVMTP
jgi:hypothetical protein